MRLPRITPAVMKELRFFAWALLTGGTACLTILAGISAFQGDDTFAIQCLALVVLYLAISHAAHTEPR